MKEISPAQVHDLMLKEKEAVFIDVRSDVAFATGTADLAKVQQLAFNMPIKSGDAINRNFLESLERSIGQIKGKTLIFMCYHGNSSKIACQMVEDARSSEVYNLIGGFQGWQLAKLPIGRGVCQK